MCCRKLSCLFVVDAQKSSRTTTRSSRSASPACVDHRHRRLPAERRVGERPRRPPVAGVAAQRVGDRRRGSGRSACRCRAAAGSSRTGGRCRRRSPSRARLVAQEPLLVGVHLGDVVIDVLVRGEQEPAGAARRVGDRLAGVRPQARDHRPDQRPRREVLAGAGLGVLGALLQQPLVGVALEVGVDRRPGLLVDQVDDQPAQLGRVLDPVLRLAEDRPSVPVCLPELEDVAVVRLQLVAASVEQRLPVQPVRDDRPSPAGAARRPSSGTAVA